MREHLKSYIDLLFAGAPHAADIKQEILQNTLDRFDDLIAQGKSPEAAYQLAISGIGDIQELLGGQPAAVPQTVVQSISEDQDDPKPIWKKVLQAIGICLYILCPVPLFVLQNELGLCGLLTIVAVATAIMVIAGGKDKREAEPEHQNRNPRLELRKAVNSIIWSVGLCLYFILSFATQSWYITWVIFPLTGAVQGLVRACMDLKEANDHEN